jgi:hypothetical protein
VLVTCSPLNQDLFFEQHLYNEHVAGAPGGALPGLAVRSGQRWFNANFGPYSADFVMQPISDLSAQARLLVAIIAATLAGTSHAGALVVSVACRCDGS